MHTKKSLLSNQELIKKAIEQIKSHKIDEKNELAFEFYTTVSKTIKKITKETLASKPSDFDAYMYGIDKLFHEANALEQLSNKELQQKLLHEILGYFSLLFTNVFKINKLDESAIDDIEMAQQKIEIIIKKHFKPTFALPNFLNLEHIDKVYKREYERLYGQGFLGFFHLPLKRFFQQSTRTEELEFLAKVDAYCAKHATETPEALNLLKLSAANLVYLKISSETFGGGSLLGRILQDRIRESGMENSSSELMDDFMKECKTKKIAVPKHLKEFYEQKGNTNSLNNAQ